MRDSYLKCFSAILNRLLGDVGVEGSWSSELRELHGDYIYSRAYDNALMAFEHGKSRGGFDESLFYDIDMLIESDYDALNIDVKGLTIIRNHPENKFVLLDVMALPEIGSMVLLKRPGRCFELRSYHPDMSLMDVKGVMVGCFRN